MELTRRNFLRAGDSLFGGAAVLGLAGCASPKTRQQDEGKGPVGLRRADLEYVPSLEGQRTIAAASVERLAEGRGR